MLQLTATTRLVRPEVELIPPLSEDFCVYGGEDTIERARRWALAYQVLLVRGVPPCAHGLCLMQCPAPCDAYRWADHANLWVRVGIDDVPHPFILAHPYADEVPEDAEQYAAAHGLRVDSRSWDNWYHANALPVRLDQNDRNVVWPLEALCTMLLATQPIEWPEFQEPVF